MLILLCILIYLVGDWRSVSRATFCKRAEFAAKFSCFAPEWTDGDRKSASAQKRFKESQSVIAPLGGKTCPRTVLVLNTTSIVLKHPSATSHLKKILQ